MALKGTRTELNLRAAFAAEAQTNRRYFYYAAKADVEGFNEAASLFRAVAEAETDHAHGLLEYLEECGDPLTGLPFGGTLANLQAAVAGERQDLEEHYPNMAEIAREEGFKEIAAWFDTLAKAEQSHLKRLNQMLEKLQQSADE